jgi:peptide/nickel transport system substrate-binding protein
VFSRSPGRRLRGRGRIALLGVLPLAIAAGCSSGTQSAAGQGTASAVAHSGGTLRIATSSSTTCIDPSQTLSGNSTQLIRPLVDSLLYQDPATGALEPWLASAWQVGADAKSFTFRLRPGATFSDGTPVSATAVKSTFDHIVAEGAGAATAVSLLAGYAGTTVINAGTVRVSFAAPNVGFLQAVSTTALAPVAVASWQHTAAQRCQGGFAGSGPFVLDSFTLNHEVRLTARPGYAWGPAAWHAGTAYLHELDFVVVSESGVEADGLASGQVQAATGLDAADSGRFRGSGFGEIQVISAGIPYTLTPNTSRPILSDKDVRLALVEGTGRSELAATALGTGFEAATGVLSTITPGYLDQSAALDYNPKGAETLLSDDGWLPGRDGIRVKGGRTLSISVTYPSIDTIDEPALELLQQQWRQIGVNLELRGLPIAQLAPDQDSGDYDLLAFDQTRDDGDVLRTVFATSAKDRAYLQAGNSLNALLAEQNQATDSTSRTALLDQIQRDILAQGYTIPLYEYGSLVATSAAVRGYSLDGSFHDTWLAG